MGIQSASATFTRFLVEDPAKKDFWEYVRRGLQAGAHQEGTGDRAETAGFASWDDLFDASFENDSHHKAEYLAFQFRVDRRKVPSVLLRQQFKTAVRKFRDENGGRWPSRQDKQKLREDLLDGLLARALPHPSGCEVVWNTRKGTLLVGTRGKRMTEAVHVHLENHLRIRPAPQYHLRWALRLLAGQPQEAARLNSMVPTESANAREEARFLGYEFLTWLWYSSEDRGGKIVLEDGKQGEIHPGERMVLSRPDDGRERVVCSSPVVSLDEARTALQRGKMVEEIQLFLRIGENEYSLHLDTDLSSVRGLRTPRQIREPAQEDEADGRFLERMYFLEEVSEGLDAAYRGFLSQRLSKAWDAKVRPALEKMAK